MGAAESKSLTSTSGDSAIRGRIGFHVLRVADGSPAGEGGIEPFFDYVVGVGGEPLDANMAAKARGQGGSVEEMLARVVEDHEGQTLTLQVWSSKRAELRDVYVVPGRDWSAATTAEGQDALEDMQPSLLGLSLRLCNPDGALEKVWHVLEILENSPAESAGLVPFGDYILGYSGGVLHKEGDLYSLVEEYVDKPLRLFVYNSDFDVTREVVIVPNRAWSSGSPQEGLLGCALGYGLLHRIPKPQAQRPVLTPFDPAPAHAQHQHQQRQGQMAKGNTNDVFGGDGAGSTGSSSSALPTSISTSSSLSSGGKATNSSSSFSSTGTAKGGNAPPPVRMTATIASSPSTPPQRAMSPGSSNYKGSTAGAGAGYSLQQHINDQNRAPPSTMSPNSLRMYTGASPGYGYASHPGPPMRSPSANSHRSSVAEIIEEEEE